MTSPVSLVIVNVCLLRSVNHLLIASLMSLLIFIFIARHNIVIYPCTLLVSSTDVARYLL